MNATVSCTWKRTVIIFWKLSFKFTAFGDLGFILGPQIVHSMFLRFPTTDAIGKEWIFLENIFSFIIRNNFLISYENLKSEIYLYCSDSLFWTYNHTKNKMMKILHFLMFHLTDFRKHNCRWKYFNDIIFFFIENEDTQELCDVIPSLEFKSAFTYKNFLPTL